MNPFIKMIKLFKKRSAIEVEVLKGIDLEHMFTSPKVAEDIRTKVQEVIQMRKDLLPKYEDATNELTLVQKIDHLPKDELTEIEALANLYAETLMEKDSYQKTLQNDASPVKYLEKYKDDIQATITQLEDHERRQAIIKNDLDILEGEKADLLYKSTRAYFALNFLKMLTIFIVLGSAIAALILTTLFFIYNINVFIPAIVIIVIASFIVLWIYIFRRYLIHDITKNQKLQKRQIELTNKIKIKFVHVQQFIDFSYKKYQVNSSEMLQLRWENYQRLAKTEARLKRISSNVATMMQDVDRILSRNNIDGGSYVTDHIDYFSSKKGRKMLQNAIEMEKQRIKDTLEQCDNDILVLSRLLEEIMDQS
ncbi:MAG: hypothetical protein H7X94_07200 [Vallitaleaceae bacterium]|nr:hypothetical protein [Vallitaleaceae bacterium]